MKSIQLTLAALLVLAVPAFGQQHGGGARSSGGAPHQAIPSHGPAPVKSAPHPVEPNRNYSDQPGHPNVPHVDGKTWVGHDTGPNDPRYHLDQPFAHGHFTGGIGTAMCGVSAAVVPAASGSTGSTGMLRRPTSLSAMAGYGTPTTS